MSGRERAGVWLKPDTGFPSSLHGNESVAEAQPTPSGMCPRRRRGIKPRDSAPAESRLAEQT